MFKTIEKNTIYELTEKKSKFIANLIYIENKLEAENIIKEFKKKYFDAKHHCYAYRVLENNEIYEKLSDDGEPSGTAGNPMLNLLQKNNLCNTLVIVIRYFGGILLGTGGLVRSYSGATSGAIEKASIITIDIGTEFEIVLDYPNFQNFEYYCQKNNINITSKKYEENINCHIEIDNITKEKFLEDIKNKNLNIINYKELNTKYIKKIGDL